MARAEMAANEEDGVYRRAKYGDITNELSSVAKMTPWRRARL